MRPPTGNLLHASAIEVQGGAVLFVGHAFAGKTTFMTEAVLHHGQRPFSNDRVFLTDDSHPLALSWPSYASYCEGALLRHPALATAAKWYETVDCPYRTQSWPAPLKPEFSVERKRVYPMGWFSRAVGARHAWLRPLKGLVFGVLREGVQLELSRYELEDARQRARVTRELEPLCFDQAEPSFLPWHGLPLPTPPPPLEALVQRMAHAGIRVLRFQCPVQGLAHLDKLLEEFHQ